MEEETWETVQIKTFTNWVNAKLDKGHEKYLNERPVADYEFGHIKDITMELRDGTLLLSLLYAITGSIFKYTKVPKHVIHKRENIDKTIEYLRNNKIEMINIGASDIEEGSRKLTLALVWRLITMSSFYELREEYGGDKQIKDKLLAWCIERTKTYKKVSISDFGASWTNGLAVSALVHSALPTFVYDDGAPEDIAKRAFSLAKEKMSVPALISAKDLVKGICDDKSIITYLVGLYSGIRKLEQEKRRQEEEISLANFRTNINSLKDLIYEDSTFIRGAIESLEGAKKALDTVYHTVREKEIEQFHRVVRYILDVDYINRKRGGYRPYAIEEDILQQMSLSVVGLFDSTSVADSLSRWSLFPRSGDGPSASGAEVSEEKSLPLDSAEKAYRECIANLKDLGRTVSYSAARQILTNIRDTAQNGLSAIQNRAAELHSNPCIGEPLQSREREVTAERYLQVLLAASQKEAHRFDTAFGEHIRKEKKLAETCPASSSTEEDTPAPSARAEHLAPLASEHDRFLFKTDRIYNYVVQESLASMQEEDPQEFMPISMSYAK